MIEFVTQILTFADNDTNSKIKKNEYKYYK